MWRWCVMSAVTLAVHLSAAPVAARTPEAWPAVTQVALEVWTSGRGEAQARLRRGVEAERGALPGRWQSVSVSAQAEAPSQRGWREAEQVLGVGATVQLGRLPTLMRQVLDRQLDALDAQARLARWAFLEQVHEAYGQWWLASAMQAHLRGAIAAARAQLEPLRQAQARGQVSALTMQDLEIELSRHELELLDVTQQQAAARAALVRLLGAASARLPAPDHLSHDAPPQQNPWRPLIARLASHPALRAAEAQRRELLARARMLDGINPAQLQLGAQATTAGARTWWMTSMLTLTIPLTNPGAGEAARLRGEALAQDAQARWLAQQLGAELEARALEYDAALARDARLGDGHLRLMRARQTALEAALARGEVTLDRALQGRRELHDAEHLQLTGRARLHLLRAHAASFARLLDAAPTPPLTARSR